MCVFGHFLPPELLIPPFRSVIVSWNVKGLNQQRERSEVFTRLKQLKPGVVFLQETHLLDSDQCRLGKCWAGQFFHSSFRGTADLIDRNIPFGPSDVITDQNYCFR